MKFPQAKIIFLIFVSFITISLKAQEKDIISYLKLIEGGQKDSVLKLLPDLKKNFPNDPSVIFLEGVLTENGQEAIPIFSRIIDDFPKSKYADASIYRLYSYYYALGLYNTAATLLKKLKKEYPASPYIKIAEREIPSENEPASTEQKTSSTENTADYKFTIQAGAFSNDSNADALKKSFENAGYFSYIKNKSVGGSEFRVVYVGKFANNEEAQNFLQVLNDEFKLNGRIVPIN